MSLQCNREWRDVGAYLARHNKYKIAIIKSDSAL
jgi:hypothetical protein